MKISILYQALVKGLNMVRSYISYISYILLVTLVVCSNLMGCSKGPGNKKASNLAYSFLSGMIPGITENEISIFKTVEKDGNTIVVVKAGGMLCNMPVIERKEGWIASGIVCNGQFEPLDKASSRALKSLRAEIKTEIDTLNHKGPYTSTDGNVTYYKAEFDDNVAAYYVTLHNTNAGDCTNTVITRKIKPLIDSLCTDTESNKLLVHDISYEFNTYDSDGNLFSKHITNKDICNNKLYCL